VAVAVAKGGAGAKSFFSLAALGGFMTMLGAVLFSWKTAVDDTKSPRERQFMVRIARFQVAFFVVSLGVGLYCVPQLVHRPVAFGLALALLILANVANGVVLLTYVVRRRLEIGMEKGTWSDTGRSGPAEETDRRAFRKALKFAIPFLLMFAVGSFGLPWKQHWIRSAVVVAAEGLVILWAFRRQQRMLSFQSQPDFQSAKTQALLRHPFISLSAILLGTALLGGVLGFILPIFLNPGVTLRMPHGPWLHSLGLCFLFVVLGCGIFGLLFAARRKILPGWDSITERFAPLLNQSLRPEAIIEQTHGPLFQQLNLMPDQRARMKELILKGTMAAVTKSMSLMNRKLDPARRAALIEELKSEREDCDAQIRQLLGEENYQAFQSYEKTIPDRTMISRFTSKSRGMAIRLNADQQAQLLRTLSEARAHYNWTTDFSRRNRAAANYAVMFSEDNLNTFATRSCGKRSSSTRISSSKRSAF
jgi:hypothetical protein